MFHSVVWCVHVCGVWSVCVYGMCCAVFMCGMCVYNVIHTHIPVCV